MSFISRMMGKPELTKIPYPQASMEGLACRWVQWGASLDEEQNPIVDTTGEFANSLQPNDVWFLAGCFGGSVERKISMPVGQKLFVPIFNLWMTEGFEAPDLSGMYGSLLVDGKAIEPDKVFPTKLFPVKGVFGNPVTGTAFSMSMYVGGLWKLLDPLSAGDHEILIRGGDGEGFWLEVSYCISVQ